MNRKMGIIACGTALLCTLLFALGLLTGSDALSFTVCLVLSWAYVLAACAFTAFVPPQRAAVALGGVATAVLYALLINLVYFTQLTTVAQGAAAPEVLGALRMLPGTWMFALDILGYGIMGLSTLLIGCALVPEGRAEALLRRLLMLHGIFFPICVVMPMTGIFAGGESSGWMASGAPVLLVWCVYFAPVMALGTRYFAKKVTL